MSQKTKISQHHFTPEHQIRVILFILFGMAVAGMVVLMWMMNRHPHLNN